MNHISNYIPNQMNWPDFSQINFPSKESMSLLGGKLYHVVVTTASEQNPAVMGFSLVISTVLSFIGRQKNSSEQSKLPHSSLISFTVNLITPAIAGSVTMTPAGLITSVAYAALFTLAGKICAFLLDSTQQFCFNIINRNYHNKQNLFIIVQQNGLALEYASDDLKNDREVVLAAVQQNGLALEYASDDLKNDREVVLAAVQQDGFALEYASTNLQDDKEVVNIASQQNPFSTEHASDRLKEIMHWTC
jgi:hypothetical protein